MKILSKTSKFPKIEDTYIGEMLILEPSKDLIIFNGKAWVLIGGSNFDKKKRDNIFKYLGDKLDAYYIIRKDLLSFLDMSILYDQVFYERICEISKLV